MINQNSQTSLRSFNVLQKLGEGSFACVYKVQRVDDNKIYAMKKAKIGQMKQKQQDNALNQVRVLASISHPNIVNYKQAFYDDQTQSLCIVMEYADAGDIQKKINLHLSNHTHFTETQIWQAFIQMTKGLRALHEINILHRDLKCANVFCTKDHKYKLGDLNVSKVAKRGMARTQTGTPYYTSPQVWKDKAYDSKCDIWSLGCVVYEMTSLSPPFKASNIKQLYTKIQRGIFQRIPSFYSDDLANMINMCLKVNPSLRPSASQILENPIITKNTPSAQKYSNDNDQTKKVNLINTIFCPRNLKSLKMALPGAKYEQSADKMSERSASNQNRQNKKQKANLQRVVSAKVLVRQPSNNYLIPKPLYSPKYGQIIKQQMRINLPQNRRQSSQRIAEVNPSNNPGNIRKQPISQQRQRPSIQNVPSPNPKLYEPYRYILPRNNSKNSIHSNNSNSNNRNKLIRNNSADALNKRRQSNNSVGGVREGSNGNSRERAGSRESYEQNRVLSARKGLEKQKGRDRSRQEHKQINRDQNVINFVENIANRCKNIQQKVKLLIANRQKQDKMQRYDKMAINYQRRHAQPDYNNSKQKQKQKQKRQSSVKSKNQNRRNSFEIKQRGNQQIYNRNIINGTGNGERNSSKSLQRNGSQQRIQQQQGQVIGGGIRRPQPYVSPYRR